MTSPDRSEAPGRLDGKRAFDLAVSGVVLVVTSPVLAVIAAAVRLESDGPALFRQERVGLNGRTFRIHKFRSLRVGAAGALISPTGDPRVTRVGAALRRSKLDELPQLLDVFTGRMSLVGPRPEVPRYVEMWPEEDRRIILSVRPGITDPASIALRNEADELAAAEDAELHYVTSLLPRKVAMYRDYVQTRSFTGDLVILGRTLRAVVRDGPPVDGWCTPDSGRCRSG
jgi:lipopolysaccharide/colanic/teichoic acid biosynthesis glycosyltransferase